MLKIAYTVVYRTSFYCTTYSIIIWCTITCFREVKCGFKKSKTSQLWEEMLTWPLAQEILFLVSASSFNILNFLYFWKSFLEAYSFVTPHLKLLEWKFFLIFMRKFGAAIRLFVIVILFTNIVNYVQWDKDQALQ